MLYIKFVSFKQKFNTWGCKCKINVEINSNVSKMIQANSLFFKLPNEITLLFSHTIFREFRLSIISEAICHLSAFGALITTRSTITPSLATQWWSDGCVVRGLCLFRIKRRFGE